MMEQIGKVDYVQLEAKAFLAEFVGMSTAESGAYVRLVFYLYAHGGQVEYDRQKLKQIIGSPRNFGKIWAAIEHKFQVVNADKRALIAHKRVTQELQEAARRMADKKDRAKRAAAVRWADKGDCEENAKKKTDAQALLKQCSSNANGNGKGKGNILVGSKPLRNNLPKANPKQKSNGTKGVFSTGLGLDLAAQGELIKTIEFIEKRFESELFTPAERKTFGNFLNYTLRDYVAAHGVGLLETVKHAAEDKLDYCRRHGKTVTDAKKMFMAEMRDRGITKGKVAV